MRGDMKPSSFRMWRKRVQGRITKHSKLRQDDFIGSNVQGKKIFSEIRFQNGKV